MITSSPNSSQFSIQNIPEVERPRERLLMFGPEAVSSTELLAIILGSGTQGMPVIQLAQEILSKFGSLKAIADASIQELCQIKGLGISKAAQLKASFTLGLRAANSTEILKPCLKTPALAYKYIKNEIEHSRCEKFLVILLDTKCCAISCETVSMGTLSQSLVHPREVFYHAIKQTASSLILVHNHPSGDPTPSKEDIEVTKSLIDVGNTMGIPIQDHLIIGSQSYVSLRQTIPSLKF